MILTFFDHLPTSTWNFFTLNVDKNGGFWTTYPPHLVLVVIERPLSDQSTGQMAADSYHNYKDDVKLISDMGMNVYRLSIAWARIIPNGLGDVNQEVG